ncbi:hypothetical protein FRB93_003834 [Tulasnella sp. JGI-2019a]|nr:hypothetical protein FRB93_003834 [Tulasnella sp. JGI-2019a]
MDGHHMNRPRDNHAKVQLAEFLTAMVPDAAQKEGSWQHIKLKSVQIDTVVKATIETSRKVTTEPALYTPFATIANQITKLFRQCYDPFLKRPVKIFGVGSFVIKGSPSYQSGLSIEETRSARRPNSLALLAESLNESAYFSRDGRAKNGGEKRNANVEGDSRADLSDGWLKSILVVEHKLPSLLNLGVRPRNRNHATHQADGTTTNLNFKRSLSTNLHRSQLPNKKQKLDLSNISLSEYLTRGEPQLAIHAMEAICTLGNRTHVFGILIDGFKTTLWYFNRGGTLSSSSFRLDEDLGFNPILRPPSNIPPGSFASLAPKSLIGHTIECPDFTLALNKLLDARFSFFGRGTMVYTAKMVKPTNRNTETNSETETDGETETNSDMETDAVLELSWQLAPCKPEWEWVDETLEGGCPHELMMKKIFAHHMFGKLSGPDTFRSSVSLDAVGFKDRELRLQVMDGLGPITEFSAADFKLAVWDDFAAQEFLDDADVQHRDISPGNFVWTWSMAGRPYPKNIDFDLPAYIERDADQEETSSHRTGTLAFLAVDILENPECVHHLRFDCESLLWSAIWIAVCVQNDTQRRWPSYHPFTEWFTGSLDGIVSSKKGSMGFCLTKRTMKLKEGYQDAGRGILNVLDCFDRGYYTARKNLDAPIVVVEETTPKALRDALRNKTDLS